jgi:hypothetical protein
MRGCIAVNCGEGVRINSAIVIRDSAFINTPTVVNAAKEAEVKVRNVLHTKPEEDDLGEA